MLTKYERRKKIPTRSTAICTSRLKLSLISFNIKFFSECLCRIKHSLFESFFLDEFFGQNIKMEYQSIKKSQKTRERFLILKLESIELLASIATKEQGRTLLANEIGMKQSSQLFFHFLCFACFFSSQFRSRNYITDLG